MPKLPTYTAQIADVSANGGRRATSEDFGGGVAVALGGVGKSLDKAYDDIGDAEARKALVSSTDIRAKYAKEMDDAAQSGADLGPIKERMNNDLASVGEGLYTAKGQSANQLYTAQSNQMFDQQSNAIAVHRATVEAQVEGKKFLTSTAALINTNPEYLQVALKDTDNFTESLTHASPEVKKQINESLKEQLNVSAAVASARIDPEGTKKALDAGKWEMTPEQRNTAYRIADNTIRENRADEALIRAEQKRQKQELNDTGRDEQFKSIVTGSPAQYSIMEDPRLEPATREHLLGLKEARAKELATQEKTSDPQVKKELWMAINAPEGDPNKIYNADKIFAAVQAGTLSIADADKYNSQIANLKDGNNRSFATRLQGRLTTVNAVMRTSPVYAAQPELTAAIQMQMVAEVEQKSEQMRAANKSPDGLIDPNSPDYYFKPERIKQVADDVQRQMQEQRMSGAAQPASQAEYDALPKNTTYVDTDEKGNKVIKVKQTDPPAPFKYDANRTTTGTIKGVPQEDQPIATPLPSVEHPKPSTQTAPNMIVPPEVQAERDKQRLEILKSEQKDNPDDKNLVRAINIQEEINTLQDDYLEASKDYVRLAKDKNASQEERDKAHAEADRLFRKLQRARGVR